METPNDNPQINQPSTDILQPSSKPPFYRRISSKQFIIGGAIFSVCLLLLSSLLKRPVQPKPPVVIQPTAIPTIIINAPQQSLTTFSDEDQFVDYVLASEPISYKEDHIRLLPESVPDHEFFFPSRILPAIPDFAPSFNLSEGIIKPSLASFIGNNAYYSLLGKLQSFQISPLNSLKLEASASPSGHSLTAGNKVFVFSPTQLASFPQIFGRKPAPIWTIDLPPHVQPVSYRYVRGKILLIAASGYDLDHPCSTHLLTARGARFNIPCSSIYHPQDNQFFDVLYTAILIDPINGSVNKPITFTGLRNKTLIYASDNSVYFATAKFKDDLDLYLDFFEFDGKPLLPDDIRTQVLAVRETSGSRSDKFDRLQQPLLDFLASVSESDRLTWEQNTREVFRGYLVNHLKDLSSTMITKVDINDFKILGETTLPGIPNNADAFNQYNNNLRAIQSYVTPLLPQEAYSDLYILRPDLGPISTQENIANGRKVNTQWFVDDKIFFSASPDLTRIQSLDSSNIYKPKTVTTLPISGSNFYLFPILTQRVLALYEKDGVATISLYNVQNSDNPLEISSVQIGPWSEVSGRPNSLVIYPQTKNIVISDDQESFLLTYSESSLSIFQRYTAPSKTSFQAHEHIYLMGDGRITAINPQNGQLLTDFRY